MFFKMSQKHTKRIKGYKEERQSFWRFFDIKAYIIMAVMGGGIGLRAAGVLPNVFVAFFYTGLGCALALAGVLFIKNYISYRNEKLKSIVNYMDNYDLFTAHVGFANLLSCITLYLLFLAYS